MKTEGKSLPSPPRGGKKRRHPPGVYPRGSTLWIKYYGADGNPEPVRISTELRDTAANRKAASKMREDKIAEVRLARQGRLQWINPKMEKLLVGTLLDNIKRRYMRERPDALRKGAGSRIERIRKEFGFRRANPNAIRPYIQPYIDSRLAETPAPSYATINRELEVLGGAFSLGIREGLLPETFRLRIESLPEDNIRETCPTIALTDTVDAAFREDDPDGADYLAVLRELMLRPETIRKLEWSMLNVEDPDGWVLHLPAGVEKHPKRKSKPRWIAIEGALREIIERRLSKRLPGVPWIFTRWGRQVKHAKVRKSFYRTLRRLKLPTGRASGYIPYDWKKLGASEYVNAGAPKLTTRRISGHATDSQFDRYPVTKVDAQREAMRLRDDYRARARAQAAAREAQVVPLTSRQAVLGTRTGTK